MEHFMEQTIHVSNLSLAICVTQQNTRPYHVKRRWHGLVYQHSGNVSYRFSDGRTLLLQPNHILYLPMNSTYNAIPIVEAHTTYAINFSVLETIDSPPFIMSAPQYTQLFDLFKECRDLWETCTSGKYEKCLSLLYSIFASMKKEYYKSYMPSTKIHMIEPAISYIQQNYMFENIKISYLAALCNISDVHFRKIFHSIYNTSPHKYIHNLRILRAKELLKSGEYSIFAVAEICGFGSDCAFSRDFKQTTGMSPSDYKKQFSM